MPTSGQRYMASSKLSHLGELLIDHSNSPGITPEWAAQHGVTGPVVGAGEKFEDGFRSCAHCGGKVLLNIGRTREREWCAKCDKYLCDNCGLLKKLGAPHKPHQQVISELFDITQKGRTWI